MHLLVWHTGGISSSVSAKGCAGVVFLLQGCKNTCPGTSGTVSVTGIQQWLREQYQSSACGDASPQHYHLIPCAEVQV